MTTDFDEARFLLTELHRMLDRVGDLLKAARVAHEAELARRAAAEKKAGQDVSDLDALRKQYDKWSTCSTDVT